MQHWQMNKQLRKTDPYEILGVKQTDNIETIKSSFKKMALKYHPDKNNMHGAKQAFSNITNAYQILTKIRSQSLDSKSTFSTYQRQTSKSSNYQKKETHKPDFNYSSNKKYQSQSYNEQQRRQFEKIYNTFKNISQKINKLNEKKKQQHNHNFKENYQKNKTQSYSNSNNPNKKNKSQPPAILFILIFIFLGFFFVKSWPRMRARGGFSTPFSMSGGIRRAVMKLNRGINVVPSISRRIYSSFHSSSPQQNTKSQSKVETKPSIDIKQMADKGIEKDNKIYFKQQQNPQVNSKSKNQNKKKQKQKQKIKIKKKKSK